MLVEESGYVYVNNKDLTLDSLGATGNVDGTGNVGGLIGYDYIYMDYGGGSKTFSVYVKKSYANRNCN